jgi:outer membrane protein
MALLNLAQLLELESADGLDIMKPSSVVLETVILPDDPENVYAVALGSRPEILSAQTRHDIAGADLRIALGGQSPKLTLNSAFSTGYSDARRRLLGTDPVTGPVYGPYPAADQFSDNISYGIGLSLSVPILNGWRVRSDIRNARLGIMQTDIMLDETRKQLYREIQQASADAVAALRKYEAGGRAVEASEEAFMYAEQRFSAGSVTSVEYNAAKTNLLNSQSELLQARYEYIFKTKVLDFYKGIPVTLK